MNRNYRWEVWHHARIGWRCTKLYDDNGEACRNFICKYYVRANLSNRSQISNWMDESFSIGGVGVDVVVRLLSMGVEKGNPFLVSTEWEMTEWEMTEYDNWWGGWRGEEMSTKYKCRSGLFVQSAFIWSWASKSIWYESIWHGMNGKIRAFNFMLYFVGCDAVNWFVYEWKLNLLIHRY